MKILQNRKDIIGIGLLITISLILLVLFIVLLEGDVEFYDIKINNTDIVFLLTFPQLFAVKK